VTRPRFVTFLTLAVLAAISGNRSAYSAPNHNGLPTKPEVVTVVTTSIKGSAGVAAAPADDPAVLEARERWLAGVAEAASRFGCSPASLIQQLPTESVAEVVKLFVLTSEQGACLVLLPVSTDPGSARYSFASGGKVDGVEIRYLSDVARPRIWNGVEVTGD